MRWTSSTEKKRRATRLPFRQRNIGNGVMGNIAPNACRFPKHLHRGEKILYGLAAKLREDTNR